MKLQLHTIPIADAMENSGECPFCYMERRTENHVMDFVLGHGASYMEADIRDMTDKEGFCRNHFKKMFDYGNSLGNAWILKTLLLRNMNEMTKEFKHFSPSSSGKKGLFQKGGGDNSIVVGVTLAEHAGLSVGSRVTLISPDGAATAFGTVPRVRTYRIVAIFDAGVNDYNSSVVFIPMHAAQIYFQMPKQVTQLSIMTTSAENVQAVTQAVIQTLDMPGLRVMDWTKANNALFGAVQVEQNVMFLILTLIILVAAFNIISSLIMTL